MKVHKELPRFKQVTLVLETQQEVNILVEALKRQAARNDKCASEMADLVVELSNS